MHCKIVLGLSYELLTIAVTLTDSFNLSQNFVKRQIDRTQLNLIACGALSCQMGRISRSLAIYTCL